MTPRALTIRRFWGLIATGSHSGNGQSRMRLCRIHAYEVTPQRTSATKSAPTGGVFRVNEEIRESLETLVASANLRSQAEVHFRVENKAGLQQRQHAVRDLVMDFAFGANIAAKSASQTLANRLAQSMDDRSVSTLLMLTAFEDGARRRMTFWGFPHDEAFQFRSGEGEARIRLLTDVFSRSSRLRKAALFEGERRATDFWSGRVLDLQSTSGLGKAADYWISLFLDCRFGLEGKAGTRLLVRHLRSAYESLDTQSDRDQLYNAMVAIRTSPKHTWSLNQFANQYLDGEAKRVFVQSVPTELRNLSFKFQRDEFEAKLNFRVFRLKDDVYVSAPFQTIGTSVHITDGKQRTLRCEGPIVDDKVRARHA